MTLDIRLADIDSANPAYLLVSGNDQLLDVVPLDVGSSVFVGKGSNCKIQLQNESVQQLHCMFLFKDNKVLEVQDWNTGTTSLNGSTISESMEMRSGDVITISSYQITAVLDAKLHKEITVKQLQGAGHSPAMKNESTQPNEPAKVAEPVAEPVAKTEPVAVPEPIPAPEPAAAPEPASVSEPISEITPRLEQPEPAEHADAVTGFDVGGEPEFSSESDQPATTGFKYDIDADLKEDFADDDAFDPLPSDMGFAFGANNVAADDDDQCSVLLMEIEQLRFEIANRDSQIMALKNDRDNSAETVDEEVTVKLVNRLEDLLAELQTSDDRIQGLEELLSVSEQATATEQEERAQMEQWIAEIENRVGQREAEFQVEVENLTQQLKAAKSDSAAVQAQLQSVSAAQSDSSQQNDAVSELSQQIEELRISLHEANEENRELRERPVQSEDQIDLQSKLIETQDELADLRLQTSQERAEMARRHAELESIRDELESRLDQPRTTDKSDARIRAMREHLKEIHEQEKSTKVHEKSSGLGGRIANLLTRLR